jgi:predicted metallo-beta-lactamase superfamily hydrolase
MDVTGCRVIMDHHALRDLRWQERFGSLWETGRVVTAAGWLGIDDAALEARRPQLWQAVRRPVAKAPTSRATMTRTARDRTTRRIDKTAKGGYRE